MNRRELVKAVAAHVDTDSRQVDEIVRGLTDVITAVVSKGEPVAISGFAKFAKVERPARMGRNPATGEQIKIKASKKARITALKGFKEAVMSPKDAPKLARGVWPPAEPAAKPASRSTAKASSRPAASGRGRAAAATAKPASRAKATTTAGRKATPARAAATRKTAAAKPAARRTARSK